MLFQECRKLQNFSSMSAIVAALQSVPQLILTRESNLAKSEKQLLRQLEAILSPEGDHRAYREALKGTKSPVAIPWLGACTLPPFLAFRLSSRSSTLHKLANQSLRLSPAVHLRSLHNFYERSSATIIVDQRPLINFARCARLLERIDDLRRYRAPRETDLLPPQSKRRFGSISNASASASAALPWVKKELDDAPTAISREYFETRVAALAEVERQMRDSHELELRALGFDTLPRHRQSS
jgi:hypothetical protein